MNLFKLDYKDMNIEDDSESPQRRKKEGEGILLPPFGLATYKMQGQVWLSRRNGRDQERLISLLSVADSWLKQLRVQHHDFNYFLGISHKTPWIALLLGKKMMKKLYRLNFSLWPCFFFFFKSCWVWEWHGWLYYVSQVCGFFLNSC